LRLQPRCYYEEAKRSNTQPHCGNIHLPGDNIIEKRFFFFVTDAAEQ
jgi:hypothetical protein